MRKGFLLTVALVFLLLAASSPKEASAVPAFSRQTGMACNSCHYTFPLLNATGRDFKSGGYTQVGGQSMVEGEFLSIPVNLNASLITDIRYQKRNGDSQTGDAGSLNKGQVQFPSDAGLFIGGKAGEHTGFFLESSLLDGDPRFTSFRVPFVYKVAETTMNVVPYTTDAHGAAFGFELLNTGALVAIRPLEHVTETSAQQFIGTGTAATGLAVAATNKMGFATYSIYAPVQGTHTAGPYLNYLRVAATPNVGGLDMAIGAQIWAGKSKVGAGVDATRQRGDAWAIDAQVHADTGIPFNIYAAYALARKSKDSEENIYNASTKKARSAFTLVGEAEVVPNRFTAAAGLLFGRTGDPQSTGNQTENALTLGVKYFAAQNLKFELNNTWYYGDAKPSPADGNMLTTVAFVAAF